MRKKARRDGMISHNINDLTISRALDLCGEFSEIEVAFMCEFLEPGDVAVEVGANIGSLTVPLANAVGEEGTFIASEPQPVNIISSSAALMRLATSRRAFATADAHGRPNAWPDDGLPQCNFKYGSAAAATSGHTGVVAW